MKNKITGLKQALLTAALAALLPLSAAAQQITVNRVYDFSGNADTLNSQINYVFADSNRIIVLGDASPDGEKPHAFVAAFDYSGNLLWQKPIRLPDSLYTMDSGYNNLIKASSGLYVAGGNIVNTPKAGAYVSKEPFLYFFNAQGDSLNLVRLPDSLMNHRMTALTVNKNGAIIACGDNQLLDSTNFTVPPKRYWFTKLDALGHILYQNQIPLYTVNQGAPYIGINPKITNIIPVSWDSVHYIVASNYYAPMISGEVLWLDSAFNMVTISVQLYQLWEDTHTYSIDLTHFPYFEFNFIARKEHPYSFFWSFPVQILSEHLPNYASYFDGLFFCMAHINPPTIYAAYYHPNWYKAFIIDSTLIPTYATFDFRVQERSELAEAVNGDLLVQREVSRPSDTLNPYILTFYFPVLLRAGDTGLVKWGMAFQYIHTVDSGIYHNFYDVSVAPDGRIVMGGYLRSRYPVSGYDTVGKVSWLVVLSDTLHDQQQQLPEGIDLTTAGQHAKLLVYPNPALNYTNIDLQDFQGNPEELTWQLCDRDDRALKSGRLKSSKTPISLGGYASGIYFIKVWYKGKPVGTVKLVKY